MDLNKYAETLGDKVEDQEIESGAGRCLKCESLNADYNMRKNFIAINGFEFYEYTCPDCGFQGREVWARTLIERTGLEGNT